MRIEAATGLSRMQSRCKSRGAILQKMRHCDRGVRINAVKKSTDGPILIADATAPENVNGERKTVTMLFADIKGSMDLIKDLDQGKDLRQSGHEHGTQHHR